jgi:putative ABC transport system permease protein
VTPRDLLGLAWEALAAHRLRARLTAAAVAVGIGSVLTLTAMGEGARGWIVGRFGALGANTLVALPGRTETRGGPPMAPATTRDITLDDVEAIARRLPGAQEVVPVVIGEALVSVGRRARAATVVGSTAGFLRLRDARVQRGQDLPLVELSRRRPVCVVGRTVARELFGQDNPLGARLRVGDHLFRVVGVMGEEGQSMMVDLDEVVLVPVADAMAMFDLNGVFRLIVRVPGATDLARHEARLGALLRERHDGEEDFTLLTPGAVGASLGSVIRIITAALVALAAVSLVVAGVGVMNVMVVSVSERTREVGILKAIGARDAQVLSLFMGEAVLLTLLGGALGVASGVAVVAAARALYPTFPFHVPGWALASALAITFAVGLTFGVLPARRAARLVPLDALRGRR